MKKLFGYIIPFFFLGCDFTPSTITENPAPIAEEKLYRPYLHFTPASNWMNDPNGMFYFNGKYHLYFQHYPDKNVWGPMHWGHAESEDMIHWEEQPIALYPDEKGYIFSGSAVVDHNNTSGFGKEGKTPIIAMFTHHNMDKEKAQQIDVETQSIAYSLDEGKTWTKYAQNPVIENPGIRDFRDPKVFWHESSAKWVMVLAVQDQVMIYNSPNMREWTYLSAFGKGIGNHDAVWECPDLFELNVKGSSQSKYVLLVSNSRKLPNSGSATQYFVGDFDGKEFILDPSFKEELIQKKDFWMDFGKDNYAGVTWQNTQTQAGDKYLIGWMSNWEYATKVPTVGWRSAMTLPRTLSLHPHDSSYRLVSQPVNTLKQYREELKTMESQPIDQEMLLYQGEVAGIEMEFTLDRPRTGKIFFALSSDLGEHLDFGYDADKEVYFIDRTQSGRVDFSPTFANQRSTAPRFSASEKIKGRVIVDKTSVEVFWDEGMTTLTETFFPTQPMHKLKIKSTNEKGILHDFALYDLKSNKGENK